MRVEFLDFWGLPTLILTFDGKRMIYFYPKENKFFLKTSPPFNFSPFLPTILKPEDLISIALGIPPKLNYNFIKLSSETSSKELLYYKTHGNYEEAQEIWIDPRKKEIVKLNIKNENGVTIKNQFSNFTFLEGKSFPLNISLKISSYVSIEIKYKNPKLTKKLPPNYFHLFPLPGSEVYGLLPKSLFSFPKCFFINLRLSERRFQNSPFKAQTDEIADLPLHQDLLTKNVLMTFKGFGQQPVKM